MMMWLCAYIVDTATVTAIAKENVQKDVDQNVKHTCHNMEQNNSSSACVVDI